MRGFRAGWLFLTRLLLKERPSENRSRSELLDRMVARLNGLDSTEGESK
ncbi:hypothetical protein HDG37_002909 [Paraburkholderia sp. MM5384-R2]|nr:hypothetical protein [Paraburkholderia sp. MM5384-R2]